jgi:hypothetical protein
MSNFLKRKETKMKAFDYFEKYDKKLHTTILTENDIKKIGIELMIDFTDDFFKLCKIRHIKTLASSLSTIKEINQKWNALGALFKKKYGNTIVIEDRFKTAVLQHFKYNEEKKYGIID